MDKNPLLGSYPEEAIYDLIKRYHKCYGLWLTVPEAVDIANELFRVYRELHFNDDEGL